MSLVEQAIARMRNQAKAAAPQKAADARGAPGTAAKTATAPAGRAAAPLRPARRISIDRAVLRANGYLAEEAQDRHFADHFRRIKRPLVEKAMSSDAAGESQVIMVTSALPGDGKTFTSINLALSIALERDVSALLIDCDVAKRHVAQITGLEDEIGLLDALSDESLDIESLVVETDLPRFSILPAGRRVDGTAELLSSNRMRQIIAQLCMHNPRRILLLDSPPLLITNEGRALLKVAGQVVLVALAGHTPRHAIEDAMALIGPQQAGGIVLNQVAPGGHDGYYGYGSYGVDGSDA